MDDSIIKLDGREFRGLSQSISAAQDDYILGHLRRSGAAAVLADPSLSDEKRAEATLTQIMVEGATFYVLAGCLTENSKKWSRAEADRNAAAFGEIHDPAEKEAMRGTLVGFVLGFFAFGEKSAETSPKSSVQTAEALPTASADPAISEISPPSSAPSPETAQSASTR